MLFVFSSFTWVLFVIFSVFIMSGLFSFLIVCPSLSGGLQVSVSPSNEPLEDDHVTMRCKADRLIYSKLAWFRVINISESEQVASVQPCSSLKLQPKPLLQAVLSTLRGTNVTLELPLPNASRRDEGLYACQVENIKTGERTCLLRRLSLKGEKNVSIFIFLYKGHKCHRYFTVSLCSGA